VCVYIVVSCHSFICLYVFVLFLLCACWCCCVYRISEKLRVESAGSVVEYGMVNGDISVTRSIGDMVLSTKKKMIGVIAEPEIHKFYLDNDDEFVIIATDGLWDVFKSQIAVTFARYVCDSIIFCI